MRKSMNDALKTHLGNANTMSSTITVAPNSHIASQMLIPRLILNYFDRKFGCDTLIKILFREPE